MTPSTPSPGVGASTAVLDHVAVAVERWTDAWPRYVHQLGGTWHSGGVNIGFSPAQLRYDNGAKVEVLQPWEPEANPFLRRFLDHSGPGPHHLTFKVRDIDTMLGLVREAGFDPVGVRLEDPQWREAFLHPRQATGVVVQLAQEAFEWISPEPEGFPTTGLAPAASLRHVTHAVRDLDAALELFHVLLRGRITEPALGPDGGWEYVDVAWAGPLALRLVSPTSAAGATSTLRAWLGDRPGRVRHLAFELPRRPGADRSAAVATADGSGAAEPGVLTGGGSVQVVAPDDNLGTGLVLRSPGTDAPT
ncbi:MAG TPA: VOC family protein [Acidimicrobiales bacterium]|nr:VOC family protein [Acidimicrobiales bacterium]